MSLEEKIHQVEAFYNILDKELAAFHDQSKLSCLSGCSACCRSPKVEASLLEMLPLAFYLYKENKAEKFYDELIATTSSFCALYKPFPSVTDKGACSAYPYRALVCRLFGSSFTGDKEGKPVMVICKDIKQDQPEGYEAIMKEAHEGKKVPMVGSYHTQLSAIDYYLAQDQYPINEAMRRALEMVMNHFYYTDALNTEDDKKVS